MSNSVPSVLTLTVSNLTEEIPIPERFSADAERAREEFLHDIAVSNESTDTAVELCCLFVIHGSRINAGNTQKSVVDYVWQHVQSDLLSGMDIHEYAVQQAEDAAHRQRLISIYSIARVHAMDEQWQSSSALFEAQREGHAKIHGVFGGQGNTRHYLQELRDVFLTYQPLIDDILEPVANLLEHLATDERVSEQYPQGLDVAAWIRSVDSQPPNEYLISAPVSFPLIGLLQLVRVKAICMSLGITPEDFPSRFQGLAGHSQGVIVATAISTAKTWDEYRERAINAVEILFWIGARSSQHFGRIHSQPDQIGSSIQGTPSPMLSVSNVTRKELEAAIFKVNDGLSNPCHAYLALVNTSQDFVISGPVRTLDALGGILGASGKTGSAAMRYLPISIPCHSPLLDGALPLIEADLQDVSFPAGGLRLTVNLMSSGSSIGSSLSPEDDLVSILIRSITSDPVEWPSIEFAGATHIIDFGPGSTSGIGTLTQGNIAGAGRRVITAGKLIKSADSEMGSLVDIFSTSKLRWGSDWGGELSPSVIKTPSGPVIRTKLAQLLKLPPIFVAGMTPTTTHPDFVAAISKTCSFSHLGRCVDNIFSAGGLPC